MKKLVFIMLLAGTGVCVAQRHPYNSRPYHPPDRQSTQRENRRPQVVPPAPRPQPVNAPAPKQEAAKRAK
jgi:hypothetical protein